MQDSSEPAFTAHLLAVVTQEQDNGLIVLKPSNQDYLRCLEDAIFFGKPVLLENVGEELDPSLQPVLFQQVCMLDLLTVT